MNRQRLVGLVLIAAGAGTLIVSTTYSVPVARQVAFADRLMSTGGWYLAASAACTAVGLLAVAMDVIRRGN